MLAVAVLAAALAASPARPVSTAMIVLGQAMARDLLPARALVLAQADAPAGSAAPARTADSAAASDAPDPSRPAAAPGTAVPPPPIARADPVPPTQAGAAQVAAAQASDDYPAAARADYVLACANVNGGTEAASKACGCSLDVIASILPFDQYERAETVLRMRRMGGGYLASEFRVKTASDAVDALREAQAEAEIRCF